MDQSTIPPQTTENIPADMQKQSPSFFAKYKLTVIALVIILIALVPLIVLSRQTKSIPTPVQPTNLQSITTPTQAPMTQQNAAPTLNAADTTIQNAMNQSSQDINQASQADTSQDSVTGI